ncbi:hypothetical protein CK203_089366 [Vitis vinifera]|uniref:Uncharacterized protein n=1 Tax=Vitis vinifera TaxID=29760 RepID=A0A438D2U2_VITVI|nr:hypothetical protein CK203_089366 [Vitis vinifera]
MSMWKDGHRRSPRISALDAWKAHKEKDGGVNVSQNSIQVMPMEHNGLGPPSRTRARKKRKLRPVQDVAVSSVTTTANQDAFLRVWMMRLWEISDDSNSQSDSGFCECYGSL